MSNPSRSQKILVILGPTASGKSAFAVKLAKRYDGEIISADSRQVYRGLDIGTCKISKRDMRSISHYLLNVASPRMQFSPARYVTLARRTIRNILRRGKLPIICGGAGQYIDALLGAHSIPDVPPDMKLRAKLEKLSTSELFVKLKKLDSRRAKTIDRHNPRRLIRALEIIMKTGRPVPQALIRQHSYKLENIRVISEGVLKIGLNPPSEELRRRIHARLAKDLRRGLIAEVRKLHRNGLSWKRLNELGLEYRLVAQYLRGEIRTKEELLQKLKHELWQYTKRQMRWWKKDTAIHWVKNGREAIASVNASLYG